MISNRLKSISKYIKKADSVIDVGCDHALLDIYLVENNIVDKVIVSDISENALDQGKKNILNSGLKDKIDARCGNGLEVLNECDNVDTVIISGMGTNTILEILNHSYIYNINKLVIQSNNDHYLLRKEINKKGFVIECEEAISDSNKIYLNIVFKRGIKAYSEEELKYGIKSMINKSILFNDIIRKKEYILSHITDPVLINTLKKEISFLRKNC